jgi:hypothetical protein
MLTVISRPSADIALAPSNQHYTWGLGLVVDQLPVSMATLDIPLSYFSYERQFADPCKPIRGGIEIGTYGFYGILPLPELGANMYVGGENKPIQGKVGLSGFYDLFVGGHGGLAFKVGTILKNRIGFDFMVVPPGLATDSKRSYQEALGLESKEKADEFYKEHGYHVKLPYFGMIASLRF